MVRSRRQSKMEEDEAVTQTQVVSSNAQGFHGSLQDVKKLRLSGGFDYSRLNLERSTKGNKDKVDIDKVKEAKLNAKLMKLSREVYDGKRNAPKDDENTISDKLSGKTPKSDLGEEADGKESRESFIANAKTQPCVFYAKGHCMRGKTCWFLHDKSAQDSEENQNTEKHVDRESRQEVFVVVDSTVMVKTLDLEGYFSKFGDVLAVKYLGLNSEGWSEFQVEMKLSATDTLVILNRKAHRIREIEVMVKHEKRSSGSDQGRKDWEMFRSPSGDERRKRNLPLSKRSTSRRSMTSYHRENHEPCSISRKRARGDEKVSSGDREGIKRRKSSRSRSPAAMSSSSKREAGDLRSEILNKKRGKEKINWESIRDSRSRSRSRFTGSPGRSSKNHHRRSGSKDTSQIDKGWHGSQHLSMDEESRSRDKRTTLDNLRREEPSSSVIVKKEDALCVQDELKSTEVQVKEENPSNHDEMKLREIRGRNCLVSPTQQVKEEVQGNVASLKKVSFSRA